MNRGLVSYGVEGFQVIGSLLPRPQAMLKSLPLKTDARCYHCNGLGHTKPFCPALSHSKPYLLCSAPRPATIGTVRDAGHTAPVLIDGQREIALLDSACFQTVVLSSLVPREKWSEDKSRISCIHGDEHVYPTAEVYLTVGGGGRLFC